MASNAFAPAYRRAAAPTRSLWPTYLFVTWTTFTTIDPISVGPLPTKPFLLVLALAAWYPYRTGRTIPFAAPVVFLAIGFPILWSIVATFYPHPYAGQTPSPTQLTIEQASRFLYLLLYLPLADVMLEGDGRRGLSLWLPAILALCGLTWVLYILFNHLGIGIGASRVSSDATAPSQVGPLAGIVASGGQGIGRIFFANHILLVPAVAVLTGVVLRGPSLTRRERRWSVAALLFATATLGPINTRGLTLGILVVFGVVATLSWPIGSAWPVALLGLILGLLLFTSIAPRTTAFLHGDVSDVSIQQRVGQAPQLLAAWEQRPVLGSGLGATLPSGYMRSSQQPFTFELTYHAILFQNGIVGLAIIIGVPLVVALRSLLAMRWLPREERALAAGGVAGVVGLLVASATNPYLISTFGMLAVAVALAVCARGVHLASTRRIGSSVRT